MNRSSQLRSPLLVHVSAGFVLYIGCVVVLASLDGGTFSISSRTTVALAAWSLVIIGLGLGVWPVGRISTPAAAAVTLFAAFTAWTGASMRWADDREAAFLEFDRTLLYGGVLLLVVLAARRELLRLWSDGIALGLVGVAGIALSSRFFPGVVDPGTLHEVIPEAGPRLSYPLGYWNGVAILVALAVPLLLSAAVRAQGILGQIAAVAPLPAIGAVVYLASSRGGALVAICGGATFVALTRRWAAVAAVTVGALGAAAAVVLILEPRRELLEEPLTAAARAQGPSAAVLLLGGCLGAGLIHAAMRRIRTEWAPPATLGWALAAVAGAALVVIAVSLHPAARFQAFKQPPEPSSTTLHGHFLSTTSSGRWQQWQAAVKEFEARPLRGGGAGSYAGWRLQHSPDGPYSTEAHSLFLETLAELGIVGLVLLGLALVVPIATAVSGLGGLRQERGPERAGVLCAAGAYLVGAAIDWMWELTVVSLVGFACLGLSLAAGYEPQAAPGHRMPGRVRLAVCAVALAAFCAEAVAMVANDRMLVSQRAAARGDLHQAARAALQAKAIEPWAASPPLQLALVHEDAGRLATAQGWAREAIARNARDWRAWMIAARIATERGEIGAARRDLAIARKLNPRSLPVDRG